MKCRDYIRNIVFPSITAVVLLNRNNGLLEVVGPYGRMTVQASEWELMPR